MNRATGRFEMKATHQPAVEMAGMQRGVSHFDKVFSGAMTGTSRVHMESVRTPTPTSAAYVAVECFEVTLDGKQGSFFAIHAGVMSAQAGQQLTITIVPDSGTGALAGIKGEMVIERDPEGHRYEVRYTQ
jgi:hypothetical protein